MPRGLLLQIQYIKVKKYFQSSINKAGGTTFEKPKVEQNWVEVKLLKIKLAIKVRNLLHFTKIG